MGEGVKYVRPARSIISLLSAVLFNYFIACDCLLLNANENLEYGTPLLVHLLFRHGDRTPIDPYPTDPYNNRSYWPEGYGQLTNIGKRQELELGKWMRRRYESLLPHIYSPDDIYVRSTDVDRTLMSAETVLAGLFPPQGRQTWQPNLAWQPIPVHTVPEHKDELLAGKKPCKLYEAELMKVMNSKKMQKFNEKYTDLYNYVTKHSGRDVNNVDEMLYVYDILYIESLKNLTLPEWTKSVFPEKMYAPAEFAFKVPTLTRELKRLKGGPFVKEVLMHMLHKINGSLVPDRKMFLYSAHDDTIATVLNTLHVFDDRMPPYSSAVILELRANAQREYDIMVFYKNSTTEEPFLLTVPGCASICPLKKFLALTENVVPVNWEKECSTSSGRPNFEFSLLSVITLGISAVLVFLLIVSVILGTKCCRKQNPDNYYYHRVETES